MLRGSCACGGIRYEIHGELGPVVHCHCSICRKSHGAAFRTRASVPARGFRWVQGDELLTRYESSPGTFRTFCKVCGSRLTSHFAHDPETLAMPLGSLDDDPGVRPLCHVYVASKAPWNEIADDLPQFDTVPGVHEGVKNAGGEQPTCG